MPAQDSTMGHATVGVFEDCADTHFSPIVLIFKEVGWRITDIYTEFKI